MSEADPASIAAFAAAGRALSDPVLLIDASGNVIEANGPALRVFNVSPPVLFCNLVVDDPVEVQEFLRRCRQSGQPVQRRLHLQRAQDGPLPMLCEAANVTRAADEALVLMRCVPEHRSAVFAGLDERIRVLNTEVRNWQRMNAEKTSLLEQLEQLATDLEASNAYKDEFLAIVSHELRSPLTLLVGGLDALGRTLHEAPVSREAQQTLQDATASASRLHALIDNLILLAQLERGMKSEGEPVLLDRVAEQVVAASAEYYPGRTVQLFKHHSPIYALGSDVYIRQVIENFISNAIKYSPVEKPIEVHLEQGRRAIVTVRDFGRGVAEEEESQIFENFFRGRDAGQTAQGLGVGLTVCRRLVETMEGEIWARRADGGGMVFGFELSLVPESLVAGSDQG